MDIEFMEKVEVWTMEKWSLNKVVSCAMLEGTTFGNQIWLNSQIKTDKTAITMQKKRFIFSTYQVSKQIMDTKKEKHDVFVF